MKGNALSKGKTEKYSQKRPGAGLFFYGSYMIFSAKNRVSLLFYHQVLIPIDKLFHSSV